MNPIIEKIQKLLATAADSGATPEEANTAMKVANRLMLAHRVSDADIRDHAKAKSLAAGEVHAEDMRTEVLGLVKVRQDSAIAQAIGKVCGVGVYFNWTCVKSARSSWGTTTRKCLTGYGLPVDLAVAVALFPLATEAMYASARDYCKRNGNVPMNSLLGRSYMDGYSQALYSKATQQREQARRSTETVSLQLTSPVVAGAAHPAEVPAGALVVVQIAKVIENTDTALAVKAKQLGLGKGRARSVRRDWNAHAAGVAAGGAARLSREVLR